MFKISVQGDGNILDVDGFAAADASRTAGKYTNVTQSATTGVEQVQLLILRLAQVVQ